MSYDTIKEEMEDTKHKNKRLCGIRNYVKRRVSSMCLVSRIDNICSWSSASVSWYIIINPDIKFDTLNKKMPK